MIKITANSIEQTWHHFGFDVWYKFHNVRDLKKEIAKMHASNKSFLSKSKDGKKIDDLVDEYLVTSLNSKERTEMKKYKQRFGVYFLIHIQQQHSKSLQVKILNEFIKQVCLGEEDLPYFATTSRNGQESYIHLWICDRELGKEQEKRYDRDYYYLPNGVPCKEGDKGAILKGAKGEIQYNKDGTPKMTGGWSPKKSRIFNRNFLYNAMAWRDAFVASFHCVMRKSRKHLKFRLNKPPYDSDEVNYGWTYDNEGNKVYKSPPVREFLVVNREAPTWKKDKYRAISQLQYFIKHTINALLIDDFDKHRQFEPDLGLFEHHSDIQNPPTAFGRKLKQLFDEYNEIFNDWVFEDEDGAHNIMYETSSTVDYNLLVLRKRFKEQITELQSMHYKEQVTELLSQLRI